MFISVLWNILCSITVKKDKALTKDMVSFTTAPSIVTYHCLLSCAETLYNVCNGQKFTDYAKAFQVDICHIFQ